MNSGEFKLSSHEPNSLQMSAIAWYRVDRATVPAHLLIIGQKFRLHVSAGFASAVQDATEMGVRVEVEEGESVGKAMRRLNKLQRYQLGWKWDKRVYHFASRPVNHILQ
jgi:hypothetical protein